MDNKNIEDKKKGFDSSENSKSSIDRELDRIERESSMISFRDLFRQFFVPILSMSFLVSVIFIAYRSFKIFTNYKEDSSDAGGNEEKDENGKSEKPVEDKDYSNPYQDSRPDSSGNEVNNGENPVEVTHNEGNDNGESSSEVLL